MNNKWDHTWQQKRNQGPPSLPSPWLKSSFDSYYEGGPVLDLACGNGRNGLWMAEQGAPVTLVDHSDVALQWCRDLSQPKGLRIKTYCADLESFPVPWQTFSESQKWSFILIFHFLSRQLLSDIARHLAPGGYILFCQPTLKNLEQHARPSRRFLLNHGEAPNLLTGLDLVSFQENWFDGAQVVPPGDLGKHPQARHEARLVSRCPI